MRMIMLIVTAYLYCDTLKSANGYILVAPSDTEAQVNQSAYLNCSSSLLSQEVAWYRYRVGDPYRRYDVYDAGVIDRNYRDRFYIDGDREKGVFNLVIRRLLEEDAGRYECQDDGGIGDKKSAELIVLDDNGLVCQSNNPVEGIIGPNDCGLEPTTFELTCGVQFHGNIPPHLEWSMERGKETRSLLQSSSCQSIANHSTCHLTTKAELEMVGSSFVCKTSRPTTFHRCSIDNLNVLYAFSNKEGSEKKLNEKIVCSANSSHSCTYRWKWFEWEYDILVASNSELTVAKEGWHRCEAYCQFGNKTCAVVPMVIHVPSQPSDGTGAGPHTAVVVLSVVVAFLLLFIFLIVLFIAYQVWWKRLHRSTDVDRRRSTPRTNETLMPQNESAEEQRLEANEDQPYSNIPQ